MSKYKLKLIHLTGVIHFLWYKCIEESSIDFNTEIRLAFLSGLFKTDYMS